MAWVIENYTMALEMRKMETLRMGYHRSRQNEDKKKVGYSQEIGIVGYSYLSNRDREIWPVLKGSVLLSGQQLGAVIWW